MNNLDQAFLDISMQIPAQDNTVMVRLQRAYDIILSLGEKYTIESANGSYAVCNVADNKTYIVNSEGCTCPDAAERARAGLCKHRLATMLYATMAMPVQEVS